MTAPMKPPRRRWAPDFTATILYRVLFVSILAVTLTMAVVGGIHSFLSML